MSLLLSAPIIFAVEDETTRIYLRELWQDSLIDFVIAGSSNAVRSMVKLLRNDGHTHVFGIRDKDFGKTNFAKWNDKRTEVFILPRHEIENYMLDEAALEQIRLNTRMRTHQEIRIRLDDMCKRMSWWLACRQVLYDLSGEICDNFPPHPSFSQISGKSQAEPFILTHPWISGIGQSINTSTTKTKLKQKLHAAQQKFDSDALNGDWLVSFSGKELLNDVKNWMLLNRTGVPVLETDWALEIARWQRQNHRVPSDLEKLRESALDILTSP